MTRQNDRQTQLLSGQIVIFAGHCPVTGRYFEPCEGNLFLTYKKALNTDDLYDHSLIGVTYNEKNSEISLYELTSKTGIYVNIQYSESL